MTEPGREADAIVVLGCRLEGDGTPGAALDRRLEVASAAYRAGLAPLVVASGGRRWGSEVEAVAMRRGLVARGLPKKDVWLESCSLTTRDNAWHTQRLAVQTDIRNVVLVTCDFHMPRALANFRAVGFHCWPRPATTPGGTRLLRAVRERLSTLLDGL